MCSWEEYWRRPPGVKAISVKGIRDLAARILSAFLDVSANVDLHRLPEPVSEQSFWDQKQEELCCPVQWISGRQPQH